MNSMTEHSNLGKSGKRDRGLTDYSLSCAINYAQAILKALTALFNNDTSNEFMDSVKFDSICPKIGNLFTAVGFGADYSSLVAEYLQPCLICLYKNTKDDYKLKSLNTEVLSQYNLDLAASEDKRHQSILIHIWLL